MDDKGFEQLWEYRRREDTSSDDNRSMPSGDQTATNLFIKCNEASCYLPQNLFPHSQTVKGNEKKAEAVKKRKVVQKTPTRVKGTRKRKRKVEEKGTDMLKDLKMYADSLIHELAVTQVDMVARMREEMKKVVGSGSGLDARTKHVRRVPDKKGGISLTHEKQTNELGNPLVFPPRRRRNCMDLNDPIPPNVVTSNSISEMEKSSHGFAGFQLAEGFGRFSGVGDGHVGFPVASRQGADCCDISSLSNCENYSMRDGNGVGLRIGGYVGRNPISSEGVIGGSMTKKMGNFLWQKGCKMANFTGLV